MKRLCVLALAGAMVLTNLTGVTVFADNIIREEKQVKKVTVSTKNGVADFGDGTAKIIIKGNAGQSLAGKEFNVYQLFHAENSVHGESIQYTFNSEYENVLKTIVGDKLGKDPQDVTEYMVIDYIQTLNHNEVEGTQTPQELEGAYTNFRYFIEELRDEMKKQGAESDVVKVTDTKADNSVDLVGLPFGYYIVDEVTQVQGQHSASSLCMVNTANPNAEIAIKSDYPVVEKKIQEDDNRKEIGKQGWNDIGDYEIGQTVPYKFISNVPDMKGYHTYYYAWHDRMDKALTFHKDSVEIKISGITRNNGYKEYTLQEDEFTVTENPTEDETFKVEIQDLKKIVDREFNDYGIPRESEDPWNMSDYVYGQKITLRYDATLNDNAAEDTGRPGFENDVKLEFSNNPDSDGNGSTGETPWDTVVCFTYKLNGLKVNNHGTNLEGAKFRLYSDEACENEVYLKKTDKGYNVINRDSIGGTDHIGGTVPEDAVEMVSNKEGIFTIYGLDAGTYWLKETEAPTGYRPILDPIKLELIPTFTDDRNNYVKGDGATDKTLQKLEYVAHVKQFVGGSMQEDTTLLETNIEEGSGNLTVVNQVGTKLPATGSVLTILILAAGTLIVVYTFKKKKVKNDVNEV